MKQDMIWKYKLYSVNVCNNSIIWDIMGENDRLKCDMIWYNNKNGNDILWYIEIMKNDLMRWKFL